MMMLWHCDDGDDEDAYENDGEDDQNDDIIYEIIRIKCIFSAAVDDFISCVP